ncbi:MAG: hypothetical protein OXT71_06965 [Acidobacteriota bacterium]|nr:hypothetical protein [Acidobacteriota bacterium]
MARHYSTRSFFRQIPNDLLARYFEGRGLFGDLDFPAIQETRSNELYEAWLEVPEDQRNAMRAEFREIFEMACEKGVWAILDEARWQWRDDPERLTGFIEMLSALPGHYHRAMITCLDHPECWRGAIRFHHADTLPYWRKRKHMGHRPAQMDAASLEQLADLVRTYFHRNEGRGKHCLVEACRRGELDYFFAYPEDYSRQQIEWVKGAFDQRPHNPIFEVVFVYSQQEGTLDLNFRGPYRAVEPLQGMFAMAILKQDRLPPDPDDERVYDLDPLRQRSFSFVYDVGSGIERVAVSKLRFSSRVRKGDRITVEADAFNDPEAVYDLLEMVGRCLPLNLYSVTQVELVAFVAADANQPTKPVSIRITCPNSCSLKYDERDLKLRAMLEASGIELKEPSRKN